MAAGNSYDRGHMMARQQQTKQIKEDAGMGVDTPDSQAEKDTGEFRQGETIVRCPTHGVRCEPRQSGGGSIRYYCPEKDCSYSCKLEKQAVVICPYHTLRCDVSVASDPHFIVHSCPSEGCSYRLRVPRHNLSQRLKREARAQDDFSSRP